MDNIEALKKYLSADQAKQLDELSQNLSEDQQKTLDGIAKAQVDQISEKDQKIEQQKEDIVGVRRQNQKLQELTDDQKAEMSEREIEHHNQLLEFQKRQEEQEQQRQQDLEREKNEKVDRIIKENYAGEDEETRKKVREELENFRGLDDAQTEEDIKPLVDKAARAMGEEAPEPVRNAINSQAEAPDKDSGDKEFSDTERGKQAAQELGITLDGQQQPSSSGGTSDGQPSDADRQRAADPNANPLDGAGAAQQ